MNLVLALIDDIVYPYQARLVMEYVEHDCRKYHAVDENGNRIKDWISEKYGPEFKLKFINEIELEDVKIFQNDFGEFYIQNVDVIEVFGYRASPRYIEIFFP